MSDVKTLAEKDPAKLEEQFKGFDSDKDGNLTDKELKAFIKSLSPKHTDEQIEKMIKEADEDGDGQFSFDEFLHLVKSDKFGCPKWIWRCWGQIAWYNLQNWTREGVDLVGTRTQNTHMSLILNSTFKCFDCQKSKALMLSKCRKHCQWL